MNIISSPPLKSCPKGQCYKATGFALNMRSTPLPFGLPEGIHLTNYSFSIIQYFVRVSTRQIQKK